MNKEFKELEEMMEKWISTLEVVRRSLVLSDDSGIEYRHDVEAEVIDSICNEMNKVIATTN